MQRSHPNLSVGHNVAVFFVGVGAYILWTAVFLIFIALPIHNKVYGVKTGFQVIEGYFIVCSDSGCI